MLVFVLNEPLTPDAAKKLIREILASGTVAFSRHCKDEMANDRFGPLIEADCVNQRVARWCCRATRIRKGLMALPRKYESDLRRCGVSIGNLSRSSHHLEED